MRSSSLRKLYTGRSGESPTFMVICERDSKGIWSHTVTWANAFSKAVTVFLTTYVSVWLVRPTLTE